MERWRTFFARRLEAGDADGPLTALAARAWSAVAATRLARPLVWSDEGRAAPRVIAVGGATLGGSGKTPLAIACAASLAARGVDVALVSHAYRAAFGGPAEARRVHPDDDARRVGDEAVLAARALSAFGPVATVIVARSRQAALDHALSFASVVVLDGAAQTVPRRAALALLAICGDEPWGAGGACPPRGDLRAPVPALLAACDRVVVVRDPASPRPAHEGTAVGAALVPRDAFEAEVVSAGAHLGGRLLAWPEIAVQRVGLVTSLARSSRVVRFLARRGVVPAVVVAGSDHGAPPPLPHDRGPRSVPGVDLWLLTGKCAAARGRSVWPAAAPRAIIDYALALPAPLERALSPTLCVEARR